MKKYLLLLSKYFPHIFEQIYRYVYDDVVKKFSINKNYCFCLHYYFSEDSKKCYQKIKGCEHMSVNDIIMNQYDIYYDNYLYNTMMYENRRSKYPTFIFNEEDYLKPIRVYRKFIINDWNPYSFYYKNQCIGELNRKNYIMKYDSIINTSNINIVDIYMKNLYVDHLKHIFEHSKKYILTI